ncbi:unnamed protein product [Boreogadus saida]
MNSHMEVFTTLFNKVSSLCVPQVSSSPASLQLLSIRQTLLLLEPAILLAQDCMMAGPPPPPPLPGFTGPAHLLPLLFQEVASVHRQEVASVPHPEAKEVGFGELQKPKSSPDGASQNASNALITNRKINDPSKVQRG